MLALQEGFQAPVDIVGKYQSQGIDVGLEVFFGQQTFAGFSQTEDDLSAEGFLKKASASEAPIIYVGGYQVYVVTQWRELLQ